jgi:hypothetical protein
LVERRKHDWNSRWGGIARIGILVYGDAGTWMVETCQGGAEGNSQWFELAGEDVPWIEYAISCPLPGFDCWRELSV